MRSTSELSVRLYSRSARAALLALIVFVGAGIVVLGALVLWASDPPIVPGVLHRLALSWIVAPVVLAFLLQRATAATAHLEDDMLVFVKTGLRIEVPCGAIAALAPWRSSCCQVDRHHQRARLPAPPAV